MKQELDHIEVNGCCFSFYDLSNLIDLITGHTYPLSILKRRIKLLNETEKSSVLHLIKNVELSVNKIDEIISNRASIENDPWKL